MSQFLSRLSKLSPQKDSQISFRLFSSSLDRIAPCLVFGKDPFGNDDIDYLDLSSHEFFVPKQNIPSELLKAKSTVGASQGWVATLKKRVVCLRDDLNPSASESNPKRISLPPLVTLPHCQTQIVTNVAMSSSSPEEEDCVVAIKFLGPQLSLCKGSKWTNIRIKDPSFFTSHVMFSQRYQMFSLPASGCDHMASWDFKGEPKLQKLHFQNLPRLTKTEKEHLFSCYRTPHLVESSAGETFLVIWYRSCAYGMENLVGLETKGFRVFRIGKEGKATYTEDIGDLCIFLSNSESFCLLASSFPGLERNYIYYLDVHEPNEKTEKVEIGGFSLCRADSDADFSNHHINKIPYIFPPQPMQ
ncbi:PREDICTED: uncharacterized protein LOC104708075 [Camelina sativa]|uniref:Uncharacterized protein LOC104708075 n=1 Tax=Camelina sativa TaxID=90675 RepID=A0ABM0T9E1_CAMSA|nr:PREDICTED: uncharacterized protein LOC104708075 [Camelina sativa]